MNRSGFVCRDFSIFFATFLILAGAACPAFILGCGPTDRKTYIRIETLEVAAEARLSDPRRALVLNESGFAALVRPVNERVALVEIRNDRDWDTVSAACAGLGPRPDFSSGVFVAVLTRLGQSLDGEWPCRLDSVRVVQGAGLATATLRGGTYLPDGTTCIDGAFVNGLRRCLVLEINDDRFPLK